MTTRTLWAAAAVAALALLPACSDSSSDTTTTDTTATSTSTSTTTTTTTATTAAAAPVDAAVLQESVDVFFDPAASTDDRVAVVEDGDEHRTELDQFTGVLAGYPLTGTVGEVTVVDDDTVTANTEVAGPHGGAPMPLQFSRTDDGRWVLDDDAACSILEMGRITCS
ncbi:nuclear transport factor 2 family protein [Rhodococcus sp. (in: high G+C Gram-positive bacteria)]|uniref:nuclear transport factor 2 family protein n=1 Tax=Rhodococcus sp. TaxID=1831 RepID=UPI00389097C5